MKGEGGCPTVCACQSVKLSITAAQVCIKEALMWGSPQLIRKSPHLIICQVISNIHLRSTGGAARVNLMIPMNLFAHGVAAAEQKQNAVCTHQDVGALPHSYLPSCVLQFAKNSLHDKQHRSPPTSISSTFKKAMSWGSGGHPASLRSSRCST